MIKSVILLCLVVSVYSGTLSAEYKIKMLSALQSNMKACKKEVGASYNDIADLMQMKYPTRREGKCFIACVVEKMGYLNGGKPVREAMLKELENIKPANEDLYAKGLIILDQCDTELANVNEEDSCEMGIKSAMCYMLKGKEVGLTIEFLTQI